MLRLHQPVAAATTWCRRKYSRGRSKLLPFEKGNDPRKGESEALPGLKISESNDLLQGSRKKHFPAQARKETSNTEGGFAVLTNLSGFSRGDFQEALPLDCSEYKGLDP